MLYNFAGKLWDCGERGKKERERESRIYRIRAFRRVYTLRAAGARDARVNVIAPPSLISSHVKRTFDRILYFNILLLAVSRSQDLRRLPRETSGQPFRSYVRSPLPCAIYFLGPARDFCRTASRIAAYNRHICRSLFTVRNDRIVSYARYLRRIEARPRTADSIDDRSVDLSEIEDL